MISDWQYRQISNGAGKSPASQGVNRLERLHPQRLDRPSSVP